MAYSPVSHLIRCSSLLRSLRICVKKNAGLKVIAQNSQTDDAPDFALLVDLGFVNLADDALEALPA